MAKLLPCSLSELLGLGFGSCAALKFGIFCLVNGYCQFGRRQLQKSMYIHIFHIIPRSLYFPVSPKQKVVQFLHFLVEHRTLQSYIFHVKIELHGVNSIK